MRVGVLTLVTRGAIKHSIMEKYIQKVESLKKILFKV